MFPSFTILPPQFHSGNFNGIVFGYGSLVPINEFVKIFPNSFRDQGNNYWEQNTGVISSIKSNLVGLAYTHDNIFVTTQSAITNDFAHADIEASYSSKVDMVQLSQEAQTIDPWLRKYFPNYPPEYLMYAYIFRSNAVTDVN